MDAKWCRPGTSHGNWWHNRYLCGFTEKNQPVWGPSLDNVGKDDRLSWRTITGRRPECQWPATERARRQTRTRLQNYWLRNFEPWGRGPTGEDLFDQDTQVEQSFGFDKFEIYYGLGYVMPYDPLADLVYSNSMKIGRIKMHSTPERAVGQRKRKKVSREPRPADEEEWEETSKGKKSHKKARRSQPQPEREERWTDDNELESESWGTWTSFSPSQCTRLWCIQKKIQLRHSPTL